MVLKHEFVEEAMDQLETLDTLKEEKEQLGNYESTGNPSFTDIGNAGPYCRCDGASLWCEAGCEELGKGSVDESVFPNNKYFNSIFNHLNKE